MNWKYKYFSQNRFFPAHRDLVWQSAKSFFSETLRSKITKEASEGFIAEGYNFGHEAVADVRIQSAANGTTVDIQLAVKRAGNTGFMLFDVGGYYNIQLRHWLDGIQGLLHQQLSGSPMAANISAPPPPNKAVACVFNGCLAFIAVIFALWLITNLVGAVVGLITGNLFLLGKKENIHIHGMWARIVSVLILLFGAWVAWRIKRMSESRSRA